MILKIVKRVTLMLQKFEDVQKSKKKIIIIIIYEDEIDGLPEYESHSLTEDEEQQKEQDNYKIQTKSKKRPPPKQIENPKQLRKGITKSIKM